MFSSHVLSVSSSSGCEVGTPYEEDLQIVWQSSPGLLLPGLRHPAAECFTQPQVSLWFYLQ